MKYEKWIGWIFFGFLPLSLIYLLFPLRIDGFMNPHDEGVWLAAIQALGEGKSLYRDVWFQYGPVLLAPFPAIAGFIPLTLAKVRALFWAENLWGLLIVYMCVLRFSKNPYVRCIFAVLLWLVPSASHVPFVPMSARYGFAFLSLLFWPFEESQEWVLLPWLAGAATGLSFWISQEMALAAFITGVFVFFTHRNEWRELRNFWGGFLLVWIPGILWISAQSGFMNYWHCAFTGIGNLVYAERLHFPALHRELWQQAHQGAIPWFVPMENMADVLSAYIPPLAYLVVLAGVCRIQSFSKSEKRIALALALFGLLLQPAAWGRSDRWHIYISLSPVFLLGCYVADLGFMYWRPSWAGTFLLAELVVGMLITWPHYLAHSVKDALARPYLRQTSVDRLGRSKLPLAQANGYEVVVQWIHRNIPPHEPFLYFPYNGAIYFAADRPNATRFPILAYAITPEQQEQAIRDLEGSRLRWVLWDTENTAFDGVPIKQFLSRIDTYIQSHFEPRERFGPFIFLQRKKHLS